MYAYLLPFQHDMDIILLPYKKTSPKKSKNIFLSMENNIKKLQKCRYPIPKEEKKATG